MIKIASEVSRCDEAAVNVRLGRFRIVWPWMTVGAVVAAGCAMTRTVYVKEQDKAVALQPGTVYTKFILFIVSAILNLHRQSLPPYQRRRGGLPRQFAITSRQGRKRSSRVTSD